MSKAAPTGVVSFFFSDIEDSTRLAALHGEAFSGLLGDYRRLIGEAVVRRAGYHVDQEGDSILAAFDKVSDAIGAACEVQRVLEGHLWPEGSRLRARIGIHMGEATFVDKHYEGLTIHRAKRICDAAHGGQVLLSKPTRDFAARALPLGASLRSLGLFRLKGIDDPEELFELVHPDLLSEFPAPRALAIAYTNLPIQLTSFIGRRDKVAEVSDTVRKSRLVTLIGPGGVGKTRLAIEAATSAREDFFHGVWMADLAPVTDDEFVPSTLATTLGLREDAGSSGTSSDLFDRVLDYLRARSALLLLDNCEHLTAACARLCDAILKSCPKANILATSREPLGISGENVITVPPLDVFGGRESSDAIALFIERARAHDPSYQIAGDDEALVEAICRQLDGLPLAIELAAAHIRTLTPAQILERLEDRFGLLATAPSTAPDRHRALRSSMDWGYELLSEPERILMARLCVFSGGFSLEGAEGVCSGTAIEASEVLGLLSRLIDKSLVRRDLKGSRARYSLLETVRQYGLEKMNDSASEAGRATSPPTAVARVTLFRREGEYWTIGPQEESFRLRNSKGLQYLALLLGAPGKDVFVLDLVDVVEGGSKESRRAVGHAGELLDRESVQAYRQRLIDLQEELEEAHQFNDDERASRLDDEMGRLSRELSRAVGLGGRERRAGSTTERARMSVTKAIRSALGKIMELDPGLGAHLDASIRTGTSCAYLPKADDAPKWELKL